MSKDIRHRIIIEFDADAKTPNEIVRSIARSAMDATVTRCSNPVFLSVEEIDQRPKLILRNETV